MLLRIFIVTILVVLGGCAMPKNDEKLLEDTLLSYAGVIRWGNFEDALTYVDPETLKSHPLTNLDLARYRQVQVTAYNEQPKKKIGESQVSQVVEIGLVNINTQSARAIIDRQVWRYDVKVKRWWLVSGLPDITTH
jgi:hypothetical protein